MSEQTLATGSNESRRETIVLNDVQPSVIREVLAKGWRDFLAAPWFGLFFGLVYAGGGWAVVTLATATGFYYLAYPLAAGFALIAPFIAAGIYDVSRSLETGERMTWRQVFCSVCGAGSRDLGWMALITGFVFFIWMDIAFFIYAIFHGFRAVSIDDLLREVVTSWNGMLFFVTGNLIGAMITSVRAVRRNPRTMVLWALTIAFLLLVSLVTLLLALVIILPVLGHASWHMYRAVVAGG